jgi:GH35 family endo-1,4-beta-xylanase
MMRHRSPGDGRGPSRLRLFKLAALALLAVGSESAVEASASADVRVSGAPASDCRACDDVRATPAADTARRSLRAAANGRFLVGTAVMSRQLDNPALAALIAEQFDCLTAENEFKPVVVHPRPGEFRFAGADRIVDFARGHRMKVVGHTLCWHSQSPAFLFQGPDGKPLPREEALKNLRDHIDGVVGHFKGKVVGWDVVNEAISDAQGEYLRSTPARRAIGDDSIVRAFEFAHAADPDAELYYNDDPPGPRAQGRGRSPRRGRDPVPPAAR